MPIAITSWVKKLFYTTTALFIRWRPESGFENRRDLKKCLKNTLREASKHDLKSIAIPAISCGVFGGRPEVCAPLLVKSAVEYFQENDCSVQQVSSI